MQLGNLREKDFDENEDIVEEIKGKRCDWLGQVDCKGYGKNQLVNYIDRNPKEDE